MTPKENFDPMTLFANKPQSYTLFLDNGSYKFDVKAIYRDLLMCVLPFEILDLDNENADRLTSDAVNPNQEYIQSIILDELPKGLVVNIRVFKHIFSCYSLIF